MNDSDIITAAREHVQELMKNNDPSHDWHHVERVYKNALYLAEKESELLAKRGESIDMLVIQLAALFHDVVDFKYEHSKSQSLEEIAHERLKCFFEKFSNECSEEQSKKVIFIILNISWRKELEQKGNEQLYIHISIFYKYLFNFILKVSRLFLMS